MSYFKTNDGVDIHYEIYGKGKPLVMLHGWDQSAKSFCKNIGPLSGKYQVITVDLRGHGESGKPSFGYRISRLAKDIYELVEYLDLKEITMLGWSMGSSVIWSYWDLFRPERLSKMIIVDEAPLVLTCSTHKYGFIDYPRLEKLYDALIANPSETTKGFVDAMLVTPEGKKEYADWVLEESLKFPSKECAFLLMNHCYTDWRDIIPTINIPTLVIAAKKSVNYVEALDWSHQHIPNSQFEVFDTGHMMFLEEPEKFNKIVADFIG
ncbi:MAG: alpha/beta hydrolase [Lachnospiraceae bacterium]|nr:alpha/beta hydrolase [Lachnospiraceae bacterium]